MNRFRPLVLAAATLLFISACSAPEDLTAPTLEPQFGSEHNDIGFDISVASNGRIFVLAEEEGSGTAYYDEEYGSEHYSVDNLDLLMYDTSGNLLTTTSVHDAWCWHGPSDYCYEYEATPRGLYADSKGFRYVLYSTNYDYFDYDLTHYITKLDASGNSYRYKVGQGSNDATKGGIDAAVDSNGNIYVAKTDYTQSYDSETDTYPKTYTNLVAKYSTTGSLQWQRTSTVGTPYGITVSSSGSVYVVGTTGVARYTNSGGLTWSKAASNSKGILEDAGNIVISGSSLYTRSGKDIRKYDSTGKQLWLRTQSGLNTLVLKDVTGDSSGNIYISGKYQASTGNTDAFVRKINASGSILWTKTFGTPAYDEARDAATISGSEIYVTGQTQGSLAHPNLGGENNRDAFIRKLNSRGNPVWTR